MLAGGCLKEALSRAGIDVDIPNWFPLKDAEELCNELGLVWHVNCQVEVRTGSPVIAIHSVGLGSSHAVFTRDAAEISDVGLLAVITLDDAWRYGYDV